MGRPPNDLLGRRFGRWIVVERVPPSVKKHSWRCRCDCGNHADVLAGNLLSGGSTQCTSCGNRGAGARPKDMTGHVFGRWTVLERSHTDSNRIVYWICRCACGNRKAVNGTSLRRGRSTQCVDCGNRNRRK